MTLQQIEYIVALEKHKHFVAAADECGITQPTLSSMIQKLEEELEVRIFDRSKHPIKATPIGEKIIEQGKKTLKEADRIKEIVIEQVTQLEGSLKLGVIPTIAPYLVPNFITNFRKKYPQIALTIIELQTKSILQAIQKGELDMAILATPLDLVDMLVIPLFYEKFIAYFSSAETSKNIELTPNSMPLEHLWVLQEGHCLRNQVFNFCKSEIPTKDIYEAGSIDTLIKIVDKTNGYTLIPELHIEFLNAQQRENIREINNPPAVREVSIVIQKDFIRERLLNAVADTIKSFIPKSMLDERLKKFSID